MDGSLSLDKVVFTFDVPQALWGTFRGRMQRLGDPHRGGRMYRESLEMPDPAGTGEKILIQWAPYFSNTVPFVRVEFNPAKVQGEARFLEQEIQPFLRRGWQSAHITRIDPAVDYPVSLQEHVYYAGNHNGVVYYAPGGIETVYLGSPQSDSRLRIYDKAKELAIHAEPVPSHPLTRIEAQQRSTGLPAAHLDCLPNPFTRLGVSRPVPGGLAFRYRLYLKEAQQHGADSVFKRLKRHEAKRFKELLATMPGIIRHPAEVFKERYSAMCRDRLALFFA